MESYKSKKFESRTTEKICASVLLKNVQYTPTYRKLPVYIVQWKHMKVYFLLLPEMMC